jgi:hypothetical protein
MLYVERDLSAVAKAVFDQWDAKKEVLNHKYLYVSDARVSPMDIVEALKRSTYPIPHYAMWKMNEGSGADMQ